MFMTAAELHSSGQVRSYAQPATSTDSTLEPSFAASGMSITPTAWKPRTRRTGLIAVKVGMTQEWDEWGVRVPLTVLWVDNCQVSTTNPYRSYSLTISRWLL